VAFLSKISGTCVIPTILFAFKMSSHKQLVKVCPSVHVAMSLGVRKWESMREARVYVVGMNPINKIQINLAAGLVCVADPQFG
jgi:hypothetical protein